MTAPLRVGIIGCGDIAKTYLRLAPLFRAFDIVACADLVPEAARRRAATFPVDAMDDVESLLARDDVDLILNLTVPAAHVPVSKAALQVGKHVYSEKPLALTVAEGLELAALAATVDRRVGTAPDTVLGASCQLARAAIEAGEIGTVVSGTCAILSSGMEHWHPNPGFFFARGGGPVFDMGPYYLTHLTELLGPVARVAALARTARTERTVHTGPRANEAIRVTTPTTIHALLEFADGAVVTFQASWDVAAHRHPPFELYGVDGALWLGDPNFFGGDIILTRTHNNPQTVDTSSHPLGRLNQEATGRPAVANYRGVGLAEMAVSIRNGTRHRCSLERGLHVVAVMEAILEAGASGRFVDVPHAWTPAAPLTAEQAAELLVRS